MFLNPQVGTVHPITAVNGFDGHAGVDIHIHHPHPAEAGGDVEGDIIARTSAGHPRLCHRVLHFTQFAHGGLGFVGEALVFEQDAYIAAGLTFVFGLTEPRVSSSITLLRSALSPADGRALGCCAIG